LSDEYKKYNLFGNLVDDKMVSSNTYVNNLRNFLFTKSTELRKLNVKGDPFNILMLDSLKGKTQQYVMANWICSDLSQDRLDTFIYDKFKKLESDPLAIKTVDKALEKYYQKRSLLGQPLNVNFINTQLEDTAGNAISFGKMMEKFKGKVVYLDVWGLGCGPCRGAMPYSKRVREKLSNKPVEFIFLTIEGMDKKRWEEAFKVSLVKENHYRLTEGWQAPLLKFMAINWVPCYMIIDKEGKLASYSAPSPFDEVGLETKLVKLTK
jgi:Thiol-disulfide isomerase and thioredoxins